MRIIVNKHRRFAIRRKAIPSPLSTRDSAQSDFYLTYARPTAQTQRVKF